jgi:hypothetical protein
MKAKYIDSHKSFCKLSLKIDYKKSSQKVFLNINVSTTYYH